MKPTNPSPARHRAFTLVEVMVAVGMVTFALVAVVSLLPSGLKSHQFATDQARNVQVLNDLTRAAKGVHKEGAAVQFLPPLEGVVSVGAGTSTLSLLADGTVVTGESSPAERRGTIRIEQLSSPVAGVLPVSISVAWPGTARFLGGKWTKNEGSVNTLQYIVLPE
jgi:type II secretory pathway pseudopilin PulG